MSNKLTLPLKVKIITDGEENPECSLSDLSNYMAIDMGRLLAKSTIRSILEKKEEILRSFVAIPGKKASKIRSKIMLDYEQILTVEVKEAFSRCNLSRSRITHLARHGARH